MLLSLSFFVKTGKNEVFGFIYYVKIGLNTPGGAMASLGHLYFLFNIDIKEICYVGVTIRGVFVVAEAGEVLTTGFQTQCNIYTYIIMYMQRNNIGWTLFIDE